MATLYKRHCTKQTLSHGEERGLYSLFRCRWRALLYRSSPGIHNLKDHEC